MNTPEEGEAIFNSITLPLVNVSFRQMNKNSLYFSVLLVGLRQTLQQKALPSFRRFQKMDMEEE